ncbi:MAG TPA: CDP-glucose 4,6-dehydratase [Gammaproteobacteria bacterium]|nr:CDP-glucose 4,6-dehydratase [Gammaproteobacteria bacterium]
MLNFESILLNKRIFVTGHTGFSGSWLCLWLKSLGISIAGFSLPPETNPSLYSLLKLENSIDSEYGDITNYEALSASISNFQPDVILHLAAQPLVRRSYAEPLQTFASNVMGTANLLEAARQTPSVKAVVCVTTDKVYKNNEWPWAYRENDPLGGKDPYSGSKAAAEMVIQSYIESFTKRTADKGIAIARGGNIIGGGDWSEDRLIPDFVRAITNKTKLSLRYPAAVRPWQHVLALVQAYLSLASALLTDPQKYTCAWNFGPDQPLNYSVMQVLELFSSYWQQPEIEIIDHNLPEAGMLSLDSSLARNQLNWSPAWDFNQMIENTAIWYKSYYENPDQTKEITLNQINHWRSILSKRQKSENPTDRGERIHRPQPDSLSA